MAKVLLYIFVDYESLGKTINILTEEGVTGFYCNEYWGVSPQNWSGFIIKEEPEMAIGAITDNPERAIQVNTEADDHRAEPTMQAAYRKACWEAPHIMRLPVDAIRVAAP